MASNMVVSPNMIDPLLVQFIIIALVILITVIIIFIKSKNKFVKGTLFGFLVGYILAIFNLFPYWGFFTELLNFRVLGWVLDDFLLGFIFIIVFSLAGYFITKFK